LAAVEEKEEVSVFERILFALFPFLIVAVLILLLLTLLSGDFRAKALDVVREVPIVKSLVPPASDSLSSDGDIRSQKLTTKILELEEQITVLNTMLSEAEQKNSEQQSLIESLSIEKDSLTTEVNEVKVSDEEYNENIVELANMFAKMTASKAAPIIQALTIDEMALIFSNMKTASQVAIMEKMNPQIAADLAMKLKDLDKATNLEIAALQSKVAELEKTQENGGSTTVTDKELANSLVAMSAESAADILKKMMKISSSKVLRVLSAMDSNSRSSILEAYAKLDSDEAALITSKLLQ